MFMFSDNYVNLAADPNEEAKRPALAIELKCWHLYWQVSSAAQISSVLSQKFSVVEQLAFGHKVHSRSSEEHNEVDRSEWRKLLGSYNNVKTLCINDAGLVGELSRCLRLNDGELPLEPLPELQELMLSESSAVGDAYTKFIDARKNARCPVILTRG